MGKLCGKQGQKREIDERYIQCQPQNQSEQGNGSWLSSQAQQQNGYNQLDLQKELVNNKGKSVLRDMNNQMKDLVIVGEDQFASQQSSDEIILSELEENLDNFQTINDDEAILEEISNVDLADEMVDEKPEIFSAVPRKKSLMNFLFMQQQSIFMRTNYNGHETLETGSDINISFNNQLFNEVEEKLGKFDYQDYELIDDVKVYN